MEKGHKVADALDLVYDETTKLASQGPRHQCREVNRIEYLRNALIGHLRAADA